MLGQLLRVRACDFGAQLSRFTRTKVQILTPEEMRRVTLTVEAVT